MPEACTAQTKRGTPCRARPIAGSPFCALHADPKRAKELGQKGGRKNRHYVETADVAITPPATPEDVKNLLAQAMADVRAGKLDPKIAHTLTYMSSALLRSMESVDVLRRLERLEEKSQQIEDADESAKRPPGTAFKKSMRNGGLPLRSA